MRTLILSLALLPACLPARTEPQPLSAQAASQATPLATALLGNWTGTLEYRDFSEPPESTKRVQLPTWLAVTSAPQGLLLDYTYDDGPTKVVTDHEVLILDLAAKSYKIASAPGQTTETYVISGLESLKEGRGTLILTGPGTENKLPAEIRITWTIRRNLLCWLEEVRPAGSSQPFAFRHRYTFTRAIPPSSGTL